MKTIIHYKNGESYTINDLSICYTDWEDAVVVVSGELFDCVPEDLPNRPYSWEYEPAKGFVDTLHEVLYIEEVDKGCGVVKLHFNPNIEMSVIVDVMTAKQRSKANRGGETDESRAYYKGLADGIKFKEVEIGERALFFLT